MSTARPELDPQTGEPAEDWARNYRYEGEQPLVSARTNRPPIDPNTGEPVGVENISSSIPTLTADQSSDAFKAAVYGKMLGTEPGFAYQNLEEVDKQLRETGGDDFDKGIGHAIATGFEETPLGLIIHGKAPDPFVSHSHLGNFIHDVSEMVSDPLMLASAFTSEAGVGIAGFAADAALRKTLMDQYTKGDVKNFGELADRAGGILWEGAKGALIAKAGIAAGEIPVGGLIGKSGVASAAMKGLYQSAVMTTAGALLNGQLPNVQDFERSAALVVPLNLVTGGAYLGRADLKQASMDVFAEDGTTPQQTADKLGAQPPVKQDLPPGLRPAINLEDSPIEGEVEDRHTDLAERVLNQKPVSMEQLEADPELADKVLQNPKIHEQDVIDEAFRLKKEAIESGASDDELPSRGELKSGRGFVTPDGKFLDRNQAKRWVKDNEPEVHQMWLDSQDGDAQAELHAQDYGTARFRVSGRNVAEGEPDLDSASPQLEKFLATNRAELNEIKAGNKSERYGHTVIRDLFVGPRNMMRAETEQIVGRMRKILPDYQDQEALSFMRDYRDDPQALRAEIEDIRSGTNEKLKAFIPSMEKALNPSPEMMQVDSQLTDYFTKALDTQRQLGILDSSIDPSRYSPRLFMKATEDAQAGKFGRPTLTQKTPHGIQRDYLRVLDPLKSGNFEARTFNALDELSIYGDRTATSVATKLFSLELKNSELGVHGTEENHPQGWEPLAGSGLYVPKVVADAMEPLIKSGGVPSAMLKVLHAQSYMKAIELSLSVFHMKALSVTAMNNMSFGDFARALVSDNNSARFEAGEREGALWGLETTKTGPAYEAYKGLKPSSLPTGLDKLSNLPIIKQVDAFAQSITRETFDVLQRKYKVMDFSQKQAAWIAKHPEAPETEYGQAMRGIAKEVNAAYGNLNWDVLGVSKGMRDIARMFILAPDWTFSNVLNLKYAGEGGAAGSAARSFWTKSFITGIALSQATSILLTGQTSKNWTQVYLGKDKEGKEIYSAWFLAGAPKDAITTINQVEKNGLLGGLVNVLANKLGPIAGTLARIYKNQDWAGKPITKKGESPLEQTGRQAAFAAKQVVPFSAGNITDAIKTMLTEPDKEYTYSEFLEVLSNVIGSTTIHQGPKEGTSAKGSFKPPSTQKQGFHLPGVRMR